MSPFAKYTGECKHSNSKYNYKFFKMTKIIRYNFDNNLKFNEHMEKICQKANRKLNALARVTNYRKLSKRRIIMNAFFKAQVNYCPVVWMFNSSSVNNKVIRLHECCLRIICNDKRSSFDELLAKDNSVSVHHNSVHTLATEVYKVLIVMSPVIK